ncbi:hypothetical protein [Granulicella aggregans]|uniref:hypothetical protein n=1 Tax=Granulicella aggregans TaxID=474949 RepID=UPI0021E06756|nr:hypothetical protein [Granulicella aggregans]
MIKTIVSLGTGYVIAENVRNIAYNSSDSLLDADIILVGPDLRPYRSSSHETFQGLPCLDDDQSFRLRNDTSHWRAEINSALKSGKTVIVWLLNVPIVAVATGEKRYSGTGRNRQTTRIVEEFDPYCVIPGNFGKIVRRGGQRIRIAHDLGIIATYWHEFGENSQFEAYVDPFKGTSLLETQTGNKTVGGIIKYQNITGSLLLLPPPPLDETISGRIETLLAKAPSRSTKNPDDNAKARRVASAKKKAETSVLNQFIATIVNIDKSAQEEGAATPPPTWTEEPAWSLQAESELKEQLKSNAALISALESKRNDLNIQLQKASELRALLFEKGEVLERAILAALHLLGFNAENFTEGDSEFDAIMTDPSGIRLIGEAEGKDSKAINVDKLDQLDRNIKEDFARQPENTAAYAQGVLFGNAHRLSSPNERGEFFTAKCMLAAGRSSISLVRTTDLFEVARYLQKTVDEEFAALCRGAIAGGAGKIVVFPPLPTISE